MSHRKKGKKIPQVRYFLFGLNYIKVFLIIEQVDGKFANFKKKKKKKKNRDLPLITYSVDIFLLNQYSFTMTFPFEFEYKHRRLNI
jgi:hypothetical protein